MNFLSEDALSACFIVVIAIVAVLLVVCGIIALIFSIRLSISYLRYNRQMVESNVPGHVVARELLDKNDLSKIKVKKSGLFMSFMAGNCYRHYFKCIRLRGLVHSKASLTSVAIAGEKVGLALLDKEKDKDMVKRIRLLPIVTFGPYGFFFLMLIGLLIDLLIVKSEGVLTLVFTALGLLFYVWTFMLQLRTLKSEKKAQERALKILRENNYLNDSEIEDAKKLYHVYNLNYIINLIIALLEAILEILRFLLKILADRKSSSNNN